MTSKKSLKRKSVLSIISIVLCISMFAGTTFAWFTDTAANTGNRIVSGTLKVDLLKYMETVEESATGGTGPDGAPVQTVTGEYVSIKDGKGDIFNTADDANNSSETLWEPGKTQIVYLAVQNIGKLALKYNILLDVIDPDNAAPAYSYAIFDTVVAGDEAFTAVERAGNWTNLLNLATDNGTVEAGRTVAAPNGKLLPAGTDGDTDYFALAIHMNEDAGNEYQDKEIVFDVTVVAGQYTYEEDTFGPDYDAEATLPTVNYGRATEDGQAIELYTLVESKQVKVTVPGDYVAEDDLFELVASNQITTTVDDETSITFDLEVDRNGEKLEGSANAPFTVVLFVGADLKIDKLTHNGTEITDYVYDVVAGTITFTTATFSPFEVEYHKLLTTITPDVEGLSFDLSTDVTEYTLSVTTAPEDAKYKDVVFSSDDDTVATVDENGVITAVANGTATITIKAADEDATKAIAEVEVTVYTSVTGINIVEEGVTVNKGDNTKNLTVSITPDTASDDTYTWESSDPTIAYVDENDNIIALKKGTVTITVTANDDTLDNYTDTVEVEVWVPVDSVAIDQEDTTLALNGTDTTTTLTATVSAAEGEDEDVSDASVTWTSSDEDVATVDENGVVTAVGVGTATITVTTVDGGKTDEIGITVVILVEEIEISGTAKLYTNANKDDHTTTLTATIAPENATKQDVTWTTSEPDIATVDENGVVTAVGRGTVIITATANDGSEVYGEYEITVVTEATATVGSGRNNTPFSTSGSGNNRSLNATTTVTGVGSVTFGRTANNATTPSWTGGNNGNPRVYTNNSITATPANGVTFTKVVFDVTTNGASSTLSLNSNNSTDDVELNGDVATWEGETDEAVTFAFTIGRNWMNQPGNRNVQSITITYEY